MPENQTENEESQVTEGGPEDAQTPAPEVAAAGEKEPEDAKTEGGGESPDNPDETIGDMMAAAQPEVAVERVDGVLECTNFRASLVNARYQAQVKCPACDSWVLTNNLECHREVEGKNRVLVAEAVDVICKKQTVPPCGYELGHIRIIGWQHSAPVDWRKEEAVAG